jgi:aminoglycoside 3-N-acetyltransferase
MANVPRKRIARYQVPLLHDGRRVWIDVQEFDTGTGIVDWPGGDYFPVIAQAFIGTGRARTGQVGAARSYLFDAAALDRFAVQWIEREFGSQ